MDSSPPRDIDPTSPFPPTGGALDRALAIVEYLREHCAWDRDQTALSLVPHLLEETHETVDAIRAGDSGALRDELGDLLLNVAFQIVVAEQEGRFTRGEVVGSMEAKMIRRHPHLFGGEKERWETIKARERRASVPLGESTSVVDGLPAGLDPLLRAQRIQEKVAGVGFDWSEPAGALEKVKEEVGEVEEAAAGAEEAGAGRDHLQEELGDLLFAVVNYARLSGIHALTALAGANVKFERRFRAVEALARKRGIPLRTAGLPELDRLWDEVKENE